MALIDVEDVDGYIYAYLLLLSLHPTLRDRSRSSPPTVATLSHCPAFASWALWHKAGASTLIYQTNLSGKFWFSQILIRLLKEKKSFYWDVIVSCYGILCKYKFFYSVECFQRSHHTVSVTEWIAIKTSLFIGYTSSWQALEILSFILAAPEIHLRPALTNYHTWKHSQLSVYWDGLGEEKMHFWELAKIGTR